MIIIRAILLLLNFTLVPIAIGRLITYKARSGLISEYLIGFFGNLGLFYILFAFCNWSQLWNTFQDPITGAFTKLCRIYLIVVALLFILWVVLDRSFIKGLFGYSKNKISGFKSAVSSNKYVVIYAIVFTIIFLGQLYMAYGYEINEWSYDDFDYVVSSQDTVSSDTLTYVNFIDGSLANVTEKRAVTSWVTYVAFLAKVSGFQVTTVSHTILPVMLLIVAYINFYYIAKFLFKDMDNRLIAMIFISVANIFGLYSHYSGTFRLLGALWQGKAVLTAIAVPFFTIYLVKLYARQIETRYMFPIAAVSLGACSLTLLSTFFISLTCGLTWVVMCIYNRRIHGIRYLIASLMGPAFSGLFYVLLWMLQRDMQSYDFKYFKFRRIYNRYDE